MQRSLNSRLQSHRILYFRCQRNSLSLCHPILNSALLPHFVFFPLALIYFIFPNFSAYLLLFLCRLPFFSSFFSSILSSLTGSSPFLRLPLISSLRCSSIHPEVCFLRVSLPNPKPILRQAVSHSHALREISKWLTRGILKLNFSRKETDRVSQAQTCTHTQKKLCFLLRKLGQTETLISVISQLWEVPLWSVW